MNKKSLRKANREVGKIISRVMLPEDGLMFAGACEVCNHGNPHEGVMRCGAYDKLPEDVSQEECKEMCEVKEQ